MSLFLLIFLSLYLYLLIFINIGIKCKMLGAGSRWTCWWRISTPPTRTTSGHSLETANTTFSHIFPHFRSMFWRIFCWNTFLFVSLFRFCLKEKIYVIGSFLISEGCIHWTTGVYILHLCKLLFIFFLQRIRREEVYSP